MRARCEFQPSVEQDGTECPAGNRPDHDSKASIETWPSLRGPIDTTLRVTSEERDVGHESDGSDGSCASSESVRRRRDNGGDEPSGRRARRVAFVAKRTSERCRLCGLADTPRGPILKCMSHAHIENVLGALGLVLADRLAESAERAGGQSAAAALVTLYSTRAGVRIDGLARVVGLSHSGAVRLVDRLAADGLVERRRGADQRSAALHLTPVGRRAARRVLAERQSAMHSVLSLLTDDQRGQLADLSESVLRELAQAPAAEARLCRLCDLDGCGRSSGDCPVARPRTRRAAF